VARIPASRPAAPAPRLALPRGPSAPDEAAAIAAFIARNGVTREVDWGAHRAIVEAARDCTYDCMLAKRHGRTLIWSLNGFQVETPELYKRINLELARRGKPPVVMPAGVAGRLRSRGGSRSGKRRAAA
jgi:hypothetical protein